MELTKLTQDLLRCPSITPAEGGCLTVIEQALLTLGFVVERLPFGEVDNLYAKYTPPGGDRLLNVCFAGHIDVVPILDEKLWSYPPFAACEDKGIIYGRGAVDMKGAIAAFIIAAEEFLGRSASNGAISLLLTSDEEGPAIDGTVKVLSALKNRGETISACVVGEPTGEEYVGDTIKIGRRGSFNGIVRAIGTSGHVAYPQFSQNPIPPLLKYLLEITQQPLDKSSPNFERTNLEVVGLEVKNPVFNIIPDEAAANLNIRYNPAYSGKDLEAWLQAKAAPYQIHLEVESNAEAFYCPSPEIIDKCQQAIVAVTGQPADLSTTGGISDARFIKDYCQVVELGLLHKSAHKVDEHVKISDLVQLKEIYRHLLQLILG